MVTSLIDSRSREEKRISRRLAQRAATMALRLASPEQDRLFVADDAVLSPPASRVPFGKAMQLKLPVLSPSVSVDDGAGGGSWPVAVDDVDPAVRRRG